VFSSSPFIVSSSFSKVSSPTEFLILSASFVVASKPNRFQDDYIVNSANSFYLEMVLEVCGERESLGSELIS